METKSKASVQERIDDIELHETGDLVELHSLGLQATFYKSHFDALSRHFFSVEKDYLRARKGETIVRTNQGHQMKLFEKTLQRIDNGYERNRSSYVRWLAVATITWLNVYMDDDDIVETVIDYFFKLGDDELKAETTQRAKQMLLWQFYCVKTFSDRVHHRDHDVEETEYA